MCDGFYSKLYVKSLFPVPFAGLLQGTFRPPGMDLVFGAQWLPARDWLLITHVLIPPCPIDVFLFCFLDVLQHMCVELLIHDLLLGHPRLLPWKKAIG